MRIEDAALPSSVFVNQTIIVIEIIIIIIIMIKIVRRLIGSQTWRRALSLPCRCSLYITRFDQPQYHDHDHPDDLNDHDCHDDHGSHHGHYVNDGHDEYDIHDGHEGQNGPDNPDGNGVDDDACSGHPQLQENYTGVETARLCN